MVYFLQDGALQQVPAHEYSGQVPCVAMLSFSRLPTAAEGLGIGDAIVQQCLRGHTMKFESHEGFDFIALMVPAQRQARKDTLKRICVYFRQDCLAFISDDHDAVIAIKKALQAMQPPEIQLGHILYEFFDRLTQRDADALEEVDGHIEEIEEAVLTMEQREYAKEIIAIKKVLLIYKRYYERMVDIAEQMEENGNRLLGKRTLRYMRMFTNRTRRLYSAVTNLRDYISQVRDAYQAQVDIHLNGLMKFFTVVAAIFLPLTLIVGWYGMNFFNMPELRWEYGYLCVIVLSVVVVGICIAIFKKKKWF